MLNRLFVLAIRTGDIDIVAKRIASEGDINDTDMKGHTALMIAANAGHTDICNLLLKNGADPNISCPDGRVAIDFATKPEVIACLSSILIPETSPLEPANSTEDSEDTEWNLAWEEESEQEFLPQSDEILELAKNWDESQKIHYSEWGDEDWSDAEIELPDEALFLDTRKKILLDDEEKNRLCQNEVCI